MTRAYIEATLENDFRIASLRDSVHNYLLEAGKFRKVSPHITVIPPFKIDEDNKQTVAELTHNSSLVGRQVGVNGLAVWKNIHDPRVVMLDVDVEMEDVREELMSSITEVSRGSAPQPVNPHITLFKTKLWVDGVDKETKHTIQREILDRNGFTNTRIKNVRAVFKPS